MKARDVDILIVPGIGGGNDDYWYWRWEKNLATARRVEQDDFASPDRGRWVGRLIETIVEATRPVVLIGHSTGAMTIVHAAKKLAHMEIKAAFLVAPTDFANAVQGIPGSDTFLPVPEDPLPFPSFVIASRNDPFCAYETADNFAAAWGSLLLDAGEAGHINAESGHGPWPEGLMVFAKLLGQLKNV